MSRDDEIDYRMMYPIEGRNRKRRSASPRPAAKPQRAGFFVNEPKPIPTKDRGAKDRKPDQVRRNAEARPRKSMLKAARELLFDYPTIKVEQLCRKLERLGYEAAPLTITTIRRDFMDTIRIAEERGYVKVLD